MEEELELYDGRGTGPFLIRLVDAIDAAADQDRTTFITERGKRVAAIVPVGDAEFLLSGFTID